MSQKIKILILSFTSLALISFSNQIWSETRTTPPAGQNDREQPVEIEANKMHADELAGISIYTGDVIAIQGSLKIIGDKMDITHPKNELEKIVAVGKPAEFESYLPEQDAWVKGKALTIIYYASERKLELIEQGYAEQENKHTITGDKIIYNLDTQILNATSNEPTKRIKMVLTPEKADNK